MLKAAITVSRSATPTAGDLIPGQMDELVRLKPDMIVSGTTAGVLAAKKLTTTVPIVSESLIDPIGFGVAASQARPPQELGRPAVPSTPPIAPLPMAG